MFVNDSRNPSGRWLPSTVSRQKRHVLPHTGLQWTSPVRHEACSHSFGDFGVGCLRVYWRRCEAGTVVALHDRLLHARRHYRAARKSDLAGIPKQRLDGPDLFVCQLQATSRELSAVHWPSVLRRRDSVGDGPFRIRPKRRPPESREDDIQ